MVVQIYTRWNPFSLLHGWAVRDGVALLLVSEIAYANAARLL